VTGAAALLAALALDLALLAPPRQAALQSIAGEITVTATRTPARLGDTAASVTVLSADELAATAAPALDDALRQVPGFSLFRRSGSRFANPTAQGASLRGLGGSGASRALVLDDGVPLNDPFGGWIQWGRVPRAALARVEVLRGGASDLYGSAALAGVVQLVRREAAPQVRGEAAFGELGSAEGSLFWAGKTAGWGAALAAAAGETDGYVLVAPEELGPVDTPAGSRHATGDLTLERALEAGRFFVRAAAFDESRRNGTPLQTNATRLFQGSIGGDWGLGRGLLAARAWTGEQDFEQTFTAVAADRGSERLTRAQEVPAETAGGSLQWTQPAGARQTLVAGIELRDVEGQSEETAFTAAGSLRSAAGGRQRTAGLFAEDLLRLSERLSLALAARWDRWENDGTGGARTEEALSPRASLLYRASARWALTAAAYRGFRAPTLNELYRAFRVGDVVTLANPALAAERSSGAEAGALLTAAGGRLTARGTLFWMEVDRTIANVTLAVEPGLITRRRENLGRSRSRGVELDLAARLGERWTLGAGWLSADAEVTSFPANRELEGLRLPQVPRRQASLTLRRDDPRATLALQARWVDAQFDDDQNRLRLASFATVDLLAARPLGRGFAAFAAVENLFDERAEVGRTPVLTLGPPRLLRVGLRFARPRP
jgi:outer membrane receptor protein involved in Fe transport